MTKSEAVEHLKNSTVKIDNSSRTGTGFFIVDKLIATCYHNIKGHSKDELKVYWQGEAYAVNSIEINQDDDLALLEIKIDKKHPILQIDESIEIGDECQSFGYSNKSGDVITFEYEGKDGDGRLKFKEGLFQSGLSGGAILNFRTHKICGIVKSKRDNTESVALGGRAIPISKLSNFERLDIDDNGSIFSKEMFKNWVWTSSVESANKLQFSILALVETFLAVGLSFFVWIYYGFYWHIITGLVVAPLFLLRTEKSERYAITFFHKNINLKSKIYFFFFILFIGLYLYLHSMVIVNGYHDADISTGKYIGMILVFIPMGVMIFFPLWFAIASLSIMLIAIFSKIYSTAKNLSIKSITKIPNNWFKLILSTDMKHPIELLPSIEKTKSLYKLNNIEDSLIYYRTSFFKFNNVEKIDIDIKDLAGNSTFLFLIIPTLIFRYSLKSTAWIYLPLIWLIQPQNKLDLDGKMKWFSKNFMAYYSTPKVKTI